MLNQVNFIGNIGRIETKQIADGKTVCKFSLAITEKSKDKEETLWMDITVWDKLAENCGKFLSKGKKVFVSGKLKSRTFEKDGVKHTRYDVTAGQVVFLSPKSENESVAKSEDNFYSDNSLDGIPF
jgi:single-strand DNA-binding protein